MNYTLNDNEMNYILDLLADRPYKESAPLIVNIQNQYNTNVQIAQEKQMEKEKNQLETEGKAKKYDELNEDK